MKDMLGNEIKVGDTIAYASTSSRGTLSLYNVREVFPDKIKAHYFVHKPPFVTCSNGNVVEQQFAKFKRFEFDGKYGWEEMTEEEKHKVANKCVTLKGSNCALIVNGVI